MISNPCNWFINGYDRQEFIYEGGHTLWHFSTDMIKIPEFSRWTPINVTFFANDHAHAIDVLKRMFKLRVNAARVYSKYLTKTSGRHHEEFAARQKWSVDLINRILDYMEQNPITLTKAPTNQFFTVGYASNDTIL